ncbi:MAG: tetratricopeptide repeat protein [Verrucomicrobiales bacterium]|nr:tetratricopeptide repeat protein [Verrucomicrobiales bacterium]
MIRLLAIALLAAPAPGPGADRIQVDIPALQADVASGRASAAADALSAALQSDPDNPRLLYDHGVAASAAGRFEDALVSLDRAELTGRRWLARRARFQKGNVEYRIGWAARTSNLEETIARWKESLRDFSEVLKEAEDPRARANFEFVRRELVGLLMEDAKRNLKEGRKPGGAPAERIEKLRNAFERFTEAKEVEPGNSEANEGEQASRDELAKALTQEGSRKAETARLVPPRPNEAPVPRPDYKEIGEGVAMIHDAQQLKPNDPSIKSALEQAQQRLANALTFNARILMAQEQQMPWPNEKLAILRMAKELVQKALEEVPGYKPAEQTLADVNKRLAEVMEERADQLVQQTPQGNLEQQTQWLSQALDFYQQAMELQPQEQGLPQKAQDTQQQLESALSKLADRLMKAPSKESLEQQAARLEGAEQALNQLQGLNPSEETGEKAEQVGEELEGVRQKLAEKGQPMPQPGQGTPQLAQQSPQQQMGPPIDAPPRPNTPGAKGAWQSPVMNRAQDY